MQSLDNLLLLLLTFYQPSCFIIGGHLSARIPPEIVGTQNLFLIFGDRTRGLDNYDLLTQKFKVTAGHLPISGLEHHSAAESRPQCRTQDICSRLPDIVSRTQYLNSGTQEFSSRTQDPIPELKASGPELTILVDVISAFSRQQS